MEAPTGTTATRTKLARAGFSLGLAGLILLSLQIPDWLDMDFYLPIPVDTLSLWGSLYLGAGACVVCIVALLWRGTGPRRIAWVGLVLGLLPISYMTWIFATWTDS